MDCQAIFQLLHLGPLVEVIDNGADNVWLSSCSSADQQVLSAGRRVHARIFGDIVFAAASSCQQCHFRIDAARKIDLPVMGEFGLVPPDQTHIWRRTTVPRDEGIETTPFRLLTHEDRSCVCRSSPPSLWNCSRHDQPAKGSIAD
jgi:hypothetical protein